MTGDAPDGLSQPLAPAELRAVAERVEAMAQRYLYQSAANKIAGHEDGGAVALRSREALLHAARCTRLVADMMEPSEGMVERVRLAIQSDRALAAPADVARDAIRAILQDHFCGCRQYGPSSIG